MKRMVSKHKKNKKELAPLYMYMKQTDKKRKQEYNCFLETASECLSIPKDVIAGQPNLSMTGNHDIRISNYHSIEEYSINRIKIKCKKFTISIEGNQLLIEFLRQDEIKIIGIISNISFFI